MALKKPNIKRQNVILILAFVVTAVVGALMIEFVHICTAKSIGLKPDYRKGFMTNWFYDPVLSRNLKMLRLNEGQWDVSHSSKFQEWIAQDTKNHAYIIGSGFVLMLVCFVFGAFLLRRKRGRGDPLNALNWFGFFLSLLFMHYLVLHAFDAKNNSLFCDDAAPFKLAGISPQVAIYGPYVIGILTGLLVVFQLPKKYRTKIIFFGMIGGTIGLWIWWMLAPQIFASAPNSTHVTTEQCFNQQWLLGHSDSAADLSLTDYLNQPGNGNDGVYRHGHVHLENFENVALSGFDSTPICVFPSTLKIVRIYLNSDNTVGGSILKQSVAVQSSELDSSIMFYYETTESWPDLHVYLHSKAEENQVKKLLLQIIRVYQQVGERKARQQFGKSVCELNTSELIEFEKGIPFKCVLHSVNQMSMYK